MDYSVEQEFKKVWGSLRCKANCNSIGVDGWNINGNAGTNPATNFIGTTDDVDLYIKRDSIITGAFTSGGSFFFGDLLGLGENQKFGMTGGVATMQMRRRFEVLFTDLTVLFKVDKAQSRIQFGLNMQPLATNTYSVGTSSVRCSNIYSVLGNFTGALTIADGTQGAGKVLTSDANGLSSWVALNAATYNLNSYVDDVAADADVTLPSGGLYKLNAGRAVYQKP
jgi:hypothetical protein